MAAVLGRCSPLFTTNLLSKHLRLDKLVAGKNFTDSIANGRHSSSIKNDAIQVAPSVVECVNYGGAVVALESAIITHGMPYPDNVECALKAEKIIRDTGAVAATIGFIKGRAIIGLSEDQIHSLATSASSKAIKISTRDISSVMSKAMDGGTTVAATMHLAARAGVSVFVTGGVGGVHRDFERTHDISADLVELSRTNVCVVSAGVKSILDIPRTLQYLETHGVAVISIGGSRAFPAFYTADSGEMAPHQVSDCATAAAIFQQHCQMGLHGGMLMTVPIPAEFEADGTRIEEAIQRALYTAEQRGVSGNQLTPFVLDQLSRETHGASLIANRHLLENNAWHGAQIALELAKLNSKRTAEFPKLRRTDGDQGCAGAVLQQVSASCLPRGLTETTSQMSLEGRASVTSTDEGTSSKRAKRSNSLSVKPVVVIGGCALDIIVRLKCDDLQLNGGTHDSQISISHGGVARNIADALTRLGNRNIVLISAVANDATFRDMQSSCPHVDWSHSRLIDGGACARFVVTLNRVGRVLYVTGDCSIHENITPELIDDKSELLRSAELVVVDADVRSETISRVMDVCSSAAVAVWYEPTDAERAHKVKALTSAAQNGGNCTLFASPNVSELSVMCGTLEPESYLDLDELRGDALVQACSQMAGSIMTYFHCLIVTLGDLGVLVLRWNNAQSTISLSERDQPPSSFTCVHYTLSRVQHVVSECGAGDCFNAGFISGILRGLPEQDCVCLGHAAAVASLISDQTIPRSLTSLGIVPSAQDTSHAIAQMALIRTPGIPHRHGIVSMRKIKY